MTKKIFKIIGILCLTGYLLAAGIMYGFWREEPRYRGLDIHIDYPNEEAHFVSEADIRQRIRNAKIDPIGKTYKEVNTLELCQLVEGNKLVRHASCYHTPDSLLRIDIEQRNPIIRVKSNVEIRLSNSTVLQDYYIDHDGEAMPAQAGAAIRLPLATGYVRQSHIQPLHDFALYLKGQEFWSDEITQIYVRENGDVELIPRIGNHTILVGTLDNIDTKLDHVRTFYKEVLPRKGWNAYKVINVKFDGQVVGEKM